MFSAPRNQASCFSTILSLCLLLGSGCRVVDETARLPGKAVAAIVPVSKSGQPDPAMLQVELQRYADEFAARTVAALEAYARDAGTPQARSESLQWKASVASAVVNIASGPNPTANLLDFLALATISRTMLEERSTQSAQGQSLQLWLETSRSLETEAWRLAAGIFTPAQQEELRDNIRKWWDSQTGARSAFFARPQEFSSLIRETGQTSAKPGSIFALVGLDPTSGLDPAVREVTRTRLFAERALYAAERMPILLRWHIELLTDQLLRQEQLTNAIASADRLSRAAESASQTAASLPDRVSAERKAILDAFDKQEGRLRELSVEVSQTLTAGEKMSTSLNTTIATFDALMKRFGVGEPSSSPPDTNSPPFNILDYARTAERIAAMAQQLDALIKDASGTMDAPALDKRIAQLTDLSGKARADARAVLNHAFLLATGLLVLSFACALLYRRLGARGTTTRSNNRSAGSNPV